MNDRNTIEIKSGDEYRISIDDAQNLCNQSKFFYPVYHKSAKLVEEIISHFPDKENNILGTDYHNNIIMYCAERGSGKSSAMFTFANALARSQKSGDDSGVLSKLFKKNICNYSFSVLSPIDPTMISESDMFMRIILSKMFSKLRDKWNNDLEHGDSHLSGNLQDDKIHRAKIVKQFTKCYRYLDVIYQRGGKFDCDDDLEDLTDLGDSGRFKDEFRRLVHEFLFEMTGRCYNKNGVMIIPIDDADLNSKMTFNIVEDIRKYCIIPNVIILMAVNIEQMHYVLEQHFAIDFKTLIDVSRADSKEIKTVDMQECHRMAMRYVDKILPAAHQIHLPTVDDFIRNSSSTLTVKYFSQNGEERCELLDFYKTKENKEKVTDYQELLLRLIHNKTGIALVKPESYLHNILPKTMRGLGHFLAYINPLPDLDKDLGITEIYELTKDGVRKDREEVVGKTFSQAKDELRKRLDNLEAFKQYFLKNWCTVRLSKKHCDAINTLENTADGLKISVASKLIDELYPDMDTSLDDSFDPPLSPISYAFIMKKINKMSSYAHKANNPSRVYMIAYAMKMYFMLFFNHLLLTCVSIGSFESLLTNVNLEVWTPFNGKFADHKTDMMFGRFSIDYNMVKKLDSADKIDKYLNEYIFISDNGRNSKYISTIPLDEKKEVKLVYDYGTMLLYLACGKSDNLFAESGSKNDYIVRNTLFTLLASYDLQSYMEKYSITPSFFTESTKDSLNNILTGLNYIDYLPVSWMKNAEMSSDNGAVTILQLANKEIALKLVDEWLKTTREECKKIGVDKTLLALQPDDPEYFQNMLSRLQSIKKGVITTMRPIINNIQKLCDASKPSTGTDISKKLSENWNKIYDAVCNYEPQTLLDSKGTEKQDGAVSNAAKIVGSFIGWSYYISNPSICSKIKSQIEVAFDIKS